MKLVKENLTDWKKIEGEIEPWGNNIKLMDKMLDEFEKQNYSLDEVSWEDINTIKKALWIGYNFKRNI